MNEKREYTVTYKVAAAGTEYIYQKDKGSHVIGDRHNSSGGHMWYSLSDGVSKPLSFGFSSKNERPRGVGEPTPYDDSAYQRFSIRNNHKTDRGAIYKTPQPLRNPQTLRI